LQAKIESLEKVVEELGIVEENAPRGRGWGGRARRRGARGGVRARGRGRGVAGRGRGGAMTLDNRTATFRLSALPDGNLDENLLREHFSQFGEVLDVRIEGQEAVIKMDSRHNAEIAVRKGSTINQHHAKVTWVQEDPILTAPETKEDAREEPKEDEAVVGDEVFKEESENVEEENNTDYQ